MVAFSRGSSLFGNQNPPRYVTNSFYLPPGYSRYATAFATTATRCYYFPLAIQAAHTFQGVATRNTGAGDNGEKMRIMVFADADGGPSTLVKDFGEITLTAAAAVRTLTSSWAATPGMYWGAIWFDSASTMEMMAPIQASGGTTDTGNAGLGVMNLTSAIGNLNTGGDLGNNYQVICHYVDTAYGAAPSTAVAPTNSLTMTLLAAAGLPVVLFKA